MSYKSVFHSRAFALGLSALCGCNLVAGLDDFKVGKDARDASDAPDADSADSSVDAADAADDAADPEGDTGNAREDGGAGDSALDANGDAAAQSDGSAQEDASTQEDGSTGACNGLVCDGVCVAANSPNHCGTCEHDCTKLPNVSGSVSCNAGQCSFPAASCAPGFAHCSTNPEDGCEVDLSKPAHCGSCTTTCSGGTPLCVGSSATQYACASGCNTDAPSLCGQTCVNTASSAAHCNGCDMACGAVTGGQAVCRNSQCDFNCNADRHRCSNTCAPNDSITQCGTGCVACPQPTGGTAACVSGSCTLSCGTDYIKSGTTCLPKYLYVSTTGSDSNTGANLVSALRSFGKAMSIAVSGQTVRFASGTYGAATGDTFAQQVPNGVSLERNGTAGAVKFLSNGSGSLVLAGSANLTDLSVEGFAMPLGITTGTQTLTRFGSVGATGAMLISGDAKVTWASGSITGDPASTEMLLIQDTASLTWNNAVLSSQSADCASGFVALRAVGDTSVTITGINLSGKWTTPLVFDNNGTISVSNGSLNNECGATVGSMAVSDSPTATVNIFNCYFGGQLLLTPVKSLKIRDSSFHAAAGLYFQGGNWLGLPIDLGKASDPGKNRFGATTTSAVVGFSVSNMTIDAAGNEWVPSQQGADAQGRYAAGTTLSNPGAGRNFQLIGTPNTVRF